MNNSFNDLELRDVNGQIDFLDYGLKKRDELQDKENLRQIFDFMKNYKNKLNEQFELPKEETPLMHEISPEEETPLLVVAPPKEILDANTLDKLRNKLNKLKTKRLLKERQLSRDDTKEVHLQFLNQLIEYRDQLAIMVNEKQHTS